MLGRLLTIILLVLLNAFFVGAGFGLVRARRTRLAARFRSDERLAGVDLEAHGHPSAPGQFTIDKIHTRSLFAYQSGKKIMVTYWFDVCYLRTFSPGVCWCCQD